MKKVCINIQNGDRRKEFVSILAELGYNVKVKISGGNDHCLHDKIYSVIFQLDDSLVFDTKEIL